MRTPPVDVRSGRSDSVSASRTACSPKARTARRRARPPSTRAATCPGPDTPSGTSTYPASLGARPASDTSASRTPSSWRADPLHPQTARAGAAERREDGRRLAALGAAEDRDRDARPRAGDPPRLAQRASHVGREEERVEAGDDVEPILCQGRRSMSPTRKSPAGMRSLAISTSAAVASMPATCAPRSAAMRQNRPAPQPTSSSLVPVETGTRSRTWR